MRRRYPLILGLVMMAAFSWGTAQNSGRLSNLVVVRLVVEAEPGILISRLNPPSIKLVNPFKVGEVLNAEVAGELARDQPKFYFSRLNPVTWHLPVPSNTISGSYPAKIRALFSLCSTERGFCYTSQQRTFARIQVGKQQGIATAVFQLREPEW